MARSHSRAGLVMVSVAVAVLGACRGGDSSRGGSAPAEVRTSALAADAPTIVAALKARAGSPLAASAATGFDAVSGGLKPRFATADLAAEPAPARVTLPASAAAAVHLEDAASGVTVDVSMQGAGAVAGQTTEGYVVYPGATATGATVVQRAVAAGTEDYVAFDAKPATTQVTYDVTLGAGAKGLRLVGGTLEVLDAGGAPRLRVAPPYIVGADGARTEAALAVAGCAVDTSAAPPWGRAVTAPGAGTCQVKVTWPGTGVTYPAILDPRWTTTGSMATARYEHTLTLMTNGKVLAAGGRSSTGSTTALATAEVYDKTTGTWGSAGSFSGARRLHSATQLPTGSNATTSGKVLIAGGINGTTSLNTAQLYDPSAGTWAAAANLNAARHLHTENLLPDGRVLVLGGMNGTATLATAALYNPASGSGSWAATTGPIPPTGWRFGTATLIQTTNTQLNNRVLLVGGNNGTSTLASVFLFDPAQNAFSTLASISGPREQHTASALPNSNGKILVTGGKNGSTVLATALIFDPSFSNGSWSAAGTMTAARFGHTATVLPASIVADGSVLVEGGSNGSSTLSSAELFSGTSTWTATPAMPAAVQNHCAVLLGNNMVLIAGGLSNSTTVTGAARLYDASFGLGCSSGSQCPSGSCVDGVCCDVACGNGAANDCQACNLAGHLGTCTARPSGASCRPSAGQCDVAETCNGSSFTCPTDAFAPSTTPCRNAVDVCDQAENCTGNSATCPADLKKNAGTACADDNNVCTTDACNGTSDACQHAPGNMGTQCRAAAGVCDLPATCSGSSATCPANPFKSNGTACPDDGNACTTDTCNGSSNACQHAPGNQGTQCRAAAGVCDLPATCSGSSATCPANPFKSSGTACADDGNVCTTDTCNGSSATCQHPAGNAGTQCRVAAGVCDLPATCSGSSATCPANPFKSASTVCRASAGVCDVAENCTGSSAACPTNAFAPPSTVCRSAAGQCDVAETCTGASATCPADTLASNGTSCSDGNNCTGPDTCQSGSCTAGANTCASIAASEIIGASFTPTLSATLQADDLSVAMGDPVGFTAAVTNTGISVFMNGDIRADNTGSAAFVMKGFSETLEYQAVDTGQWTPFARVVYGTDGNVVPESTLPQIVLSSVFALEGSSGTIFPSVPANQNSNYVTDTSIPAGGFARWLFQTNGNLALAPDVVDIVFNAAESGGVRSVIRFDMPSGAPQAGVYALDTATEGVTGDIDDVVAQLHIGFGNDPVPDHVTALSSVETGPLPSGGIRIFTGTIATPSMAPRPAFPGETVDHYVNRLFEAQGGYHPFIVATGQAAPISPQAVAAGPVNIFIEMPFLWPTKTGPTSINAGLSGTYSLSIVNNGNAAASALSVTDSVDGSPVSITDVTVPATVGPNPATGTATFKTGTPLDRPVGPITDTAALSWQDRNGNVFGPFDPQSSSYTGNVTPGHPEGYLSVKVDTGIPDVIGYSKPIVVTALDPYGNPAPGVVAHFAVTGVNPQTADVTTGADGKATFSYAGTVMGDDTVLVSATITTTQITLAPIAVQWAESIGTPCTGRTTPLDVMLVVDVSGSMQAEPVSGGFTFNTGKLQAAQAAADRFIDDLTYPRDQVGVATFMGSIISSAQLATGAANAKAQLDSGIEAGILCTNIFCPGGSDVANALTFALAELEGPRHRPDAQKVIIYVGDGGADVDPTAAIASLRSSGVRTVAIGLGSNFDGQMAVVRQIADGPNDYFYSPSGAGIDFAFNNLNQDLCRNLAPFVSAGGDQGFYNVRIPSFLTLQGEVHDDGAAGDQRLTSEWTKISGPGVVTFADATSPVTEALFELPGTYVLQLEASDGYLTVADRATITVDPDPSIVGATLNVALSPPGPIETGQTETLTATLRDSASVPIRDYALRVTVAGANPVTTTLLTDGNGVAVFKYKGQKVGTDVLHATALGSTLSLDSNFVSLQWVQQASGGAFLTQGWIGSPSDQSRISERVDVKLSPDVTLASGTLKYYPTAASTDVHFLATNVSRAPGTTIATFDTTLVSNGSYILQLDGTDDAGHQKTSVALVTVEGDYKPGRVVVELTDFTIPIAGLPITIGRRYDSLEKDKVGDFGYGWSLAIGHPRLEVSPTFNVSLTLPNGRRATFDLNITAVSNDLGAPNYFGVFTPGYQGEPGVFGTLTQEGACPLVRYNPGNPDNPIPCFLTGAVGVFSYAPEHYTYTDPYGTAYRMAASGELKSITDRQGNTLSFEPNGIVSSTGKSVTFVRDAQGRIEKIDYPALFGANDHAAQYEYDPATGDLVTVTLPPSSNDGTEAFQYTYDQHRLLTTVDPRNNTVRTSTYDVNGRLATDKDALNHQWTYDYNLELRKTTTTFPDTGVASQTFDSRGLVLSETDQRGNTTTHEYDADRNETKRTNALGEVTTATYDRGNQTSVTDPTGTAHTEYDEFNVLTKITDRLGHITRIDYDDRHVPKRFYDALGTRFTFTNSEQGLPLTVDDAEGHRAYLDYNAAGDVTGRTDWLGRTTRATYDEGGRKLTETTGRGGVTTNQYNFGFGRLAFATDPNGYTRQMGYDRNGNKVVENDSPIIHDENNFTYNALNQLTEVKHYPDNTTVSYTRDFRGNPLTMTDENGHTTRYEYDLAGNLVKTIFPDDDTNPNNNPFVTRTYDVLNRLKTVTDERGPGHTTTYDYDPGCGCSDRIAKVTDPLGNQTKTTYDANGRRVSIEDANHHVTTFDYDIRGHLTDTHYPDGTSTHEEYDARGRRVSMTIGIAATDPAGKTTFYGYDDQGQLTSVTDPLNNVTSYDYDLDGNLKSVTDANGHTTAYEYDLLKRKRKRTLPLGQFEMFDYDLGGRQTSHTDFRGKTTLMTYDNRDRMMTKVPDPSLGEPSESYTYWPTGLRHTATKGTETTSYDYDARDRLHSKTVPFAGTLTYGYDPAGNVASIVSSNANGTNVSYIWDANNQLAFVTDNNQPRGTPASAYTNTATHRPFTFAQPNGIGVTYSYDALDRVTSMLWQHGTDPALGSWAYSHNERGQRTSSTDITGRSAAYGYDDASRLTSETITGDPRGATLNGALSYVLDAVGNRSSRTSTLAALGAQAFTYNANDEISGDTFDANGNSTASDGHTYTYDFENRLVSKDAGAVTITYDCDGNRVAKMVGGATTRYLVDDLNPTGYLQVLEEIIGNAVQTRYTYGTNIVSQTRSVPGTPTTSYFGYDAQRNITFLTDATGAVTDSYDYDAWGLLVASTGSTPNTRLYEGQELDPDIGLINLRARQYKPSTGRFLTLDPISAELLNTVSLNRYLFASSDPVNLWDPRGTLEDTAGYAALYEFTKRLAGAIVLGIAVGIGAHLMATYEGVPSDPARSLGEKIPMLSCLEAAKLAKDECLKQGGGALWCGTKYVGALLLCIKFAFMDPFNGGGAGG